MVLSIAVESVGDGGNAEGPQRSYIDDPIKGGEKGAGAATFCDVVTAAKGEDKLTPLQVLLEHGEKKMGFDHCCKYSYDGDDLSYLIMAG